MDELDVSSLILRSKDGLLADDELEAVAAQLSALRPSAYAAKLIYVLGRSGHRASESLIASFLASPDEPEPSATALSILCSQWGLTRKYRASIVDALRGYEWDLDEEVRLSGVSAAERHLKQVQDCEILAALIEIASEHDFDSFQDAALTTLLRADYVDFMDARAPRDRALRDAWRSTVLNHARRRVERECTSHYSVNQQSPSTRRDPGRPARVPDGKIAALKLQRWLTSPGAVLNLSDEDMHGADLSDMELAGSWFADCNMREVVMRRAGLDRSHFDGADLGGADLSEAHLHGASFRRVKLRECVLDGASLPSASIIESDGRGVSFRRCDFSAATVAATDAQGADFSDCLVDDTILDIRIDDLTRFDGMRGKLSAEFTLARGGISIALEGRGLQGWLRARGADVEIVHTRRAPERTNG